jgi:hypothetical protein
MPDLIIIGNGFDKAHGLRTDYRDFMTLFFDKNALGQLDGRELIQFKGIAKNFNSLINLNPEEMKDQVVFHNQFFEKFCRSLS